MSCFQNFQNKMSGFSKRDWFQAVKKNNISVVEMHLREYAKTYDDSYPHFTALMYASTAGYEQLVDILLPLEGRVSTRTGWVALMAAADAGHIEIVRKLVKAEHGLSTTKAFNCYRVGTTSLLIAASKNNISVVSILYDLERDTSGWNDLFIAALYASPSRIKQALPQYKMQLDIYRRTPLMYLAMHNHDNMSQEALENAVKLLAQYQDGFDDYYGKTALIYATEANNPSVVQLLVHYTKSEVRKKMVSFQGKTSLMIAAERGYTSVLSILLPYEKKIVNSMGVSALMLAARSGHTDCVRLLAPHEASLSLIAKYESFPIGATALSISQVGKNAEIITILKEYEVDRQKRLPPQNNPDSPGQTPPEVTLCSPVADTAVSSQSAMVSENTTPNPGHSTNVQQSITQISLESPGNKKSRNTFPGLDRTHSETADDGNCRDAVFVDSAIKLSTFEDLADNTVTDSTYKRCSTSPPHNADNNTVDNTDKGPRKQVVRSILVETLNSQAARSAISDAQLLAHGRKKEPFIHGEGICENIGEACPAFSTSKPKKFNADEYLAEHFDSIMMVDTGLSEASPPLVQPSKRTTYGERRARAFVGSKEQQDNRTANVSHMRPVVMDSAVETPAALDRKLDRKAHPTEQCSHASGCFSDKPTHQRPNVSFADHTSICSLPLSGTGRAADMPSTLSTILLELRSTRELLDKYAYDNRKLIEELHLLKEELQSESADKESSSTKAMSLQAAVDKLVSDKTRLKGALRDANTYLCEENAHMQKMRAAYSDSEVKAANASTENIELRAIIDEQRTQIQRLLEENGSLKNQNYVAMDQNKDLQQQVADSEKEVASRRSDLEKYITEAERLRAELHYMRLESDGPSVPAGRCTSAASPSVELMSLRKERGRLAQTLKITEDVLADHHIPERFLEKYNRYINSSSVEAAVKTFLLNNKVMHLDLDTCKDEIERLENMVDFLTTELERREGKSKRTKLDSEQVSLKEEAS